MESETNDLNPFLELFTAGKITQLSVAILVFLLGFFFARLAKKGAQSLTRHLSPQQSMIAGRTASVVVLVITFVVALNQAGIEISVALGAFGIFTVAIGFAAQTSASNLISGLFLMGEKPFVIGDEIQVGNTVGEVIAIDLLSAKLRTGDHLLVRIPNETLLRSEITNLSRFPQRRLDLRLDLAYRTDLEKVKQILDGIAAQNELALKEPAPALVFAGFGETALQLRYGVWTSPAHYAELKTQMLSAIKTAFEQEGISFTPPARNLVISAPVEVRMVESEPAPPETPGPEPADLQGDGRKSRPTSFQPRAS